MNKELVIGVVFKDAYDDESGFSNIFVGGYDDVAEKINKLGEQLCDEMGIPKQEHNYGENGEFSVYHRVVPGKHYITHLLCEDDNTNRVYVNVSKMSFDVRLDFIYG